MNATELRQSITQTIVEALASGTVPWKRPWTNDPNCGSPVNIVSRHAYKGINPLLLTIASIKNGFVSRYWASYKQWRSMGGQVRKGSKGSIIVFYRTIEKEPELGDEKSKRFFLLRYYTLFNLDQVDGATLEKYRPGRSNVTEPAPADWTKVADEVIAATSADSGFHSVVFTDGAGRTQSGGGLSVGAIKRAGIRLRKRVSAAIPATRAIIRPVFFSTIYDTELNCTGRGRSCLSVGAKKRPE